MMQNIRIPWNMALPKVVTAIFITVALVTGWYFPVAASNDSDLHTYKGTGEKPVDLHSQHAQMDNSIPQARKFEGRVEQLRNSEITEPESDWNRVYAIGRQAYVDGDYKRAL